MTRLIPLVALIATAAYAQAPVLPPTLALKLPAKAKPGETLKGTAVVSFGEGLHGYQNPPTMDYQIPLRLTLNEKGFKLDKVRYPAGVDFKMQGETGPSKVYKDTIEVPFEVKVPDKAGAYRPAFRLEVQQCNLTNCFPPETVKLRHRLQVAK